MESNVYHVIQNAKAAMALALKSATVALTSKFSLMEQIRMMAQTLSSIALVFAQSYSPTNTMTGHMDHFVLMFLKELR